MTAALLAAAAAKPAPPQRAPALARAAAGDLVGSILDEPRSSDEQAFRTALWQYAQQRSNRLFQPLEPVLGGAAPTLNFVAAGSPITPNHMSENIRGTPLAPAGEINMDPFSVDGLIVNSAPAHSVVVNQMPHEMAHTRQTQQVLADTAASEGGAQAFADLVAAAAAQKAGVPYTPGDYDGSYTDFVKQAQARGNNWILGGQFGRPPVAFP